ncbi:MAG: VanZ family protein [Chloroflexi bacterium]|nr:MAG: VanZ family protein [Chloroflexota bacterium]
MSLFTSNRERLLWFCVLAVMVAIYSTLGLAGRLAEVLRERDLVEALFAFGFLLVLVTILGSAMKRRPGRREIWVTIGVTAVYGMLLLRVFLSPQERTHLIEYGVVAVLIYHALIERRRNGRNVPTPALLAVLLTVLLGWLDEGIQAFLPNRTYDVRDIAFNVLAGLMAVVASQALAWARRRRG